MENSIINAVKNYISSDVINSLGVTTNENSDNINKAFDASIPAILLGLSKQSDSGLNGILSKVKELFSSTGSLDVESKISGFSTVIGSIFGDDKSGVFDAISSYSGISKSSANSVMNTSALGIFEYLKNLSPNFDINSIKSFITEHSGSLMSLLPAGLSLGSLGSLFASTPNKELEHVNEVVNTNVENQYATKESPYKTQDEIREDKKSGSSILKFLIPLLIGIAAIVFLYKSCDKNKVVPENPDGNRDTVTQIDTNKTVTTPVRESLKVKLPNGIEIDAFKGGIEDNLVAFLNKGDFKTMSEDDLKEMWFDFDNLNFEHGTSNVLPESKVQLDNIVAILKAFPDAKVKIGGYTDKTGDEAINKKLSNERALAVKNHIGANGLGTQVAGAEGYGSEFAKFEASAPETERVLDRKVSLSVRNK